MLNEIMTRNKGAVPDPFGEYYDWLELHNASDVEVDVGGYGLTNKIAKGIRYFIPTGTKIPPRGYLVIYCPGNAPLELQSSSSTNPALYAPFKISSSGMLMLLEPSGRVIDTRMLQPVDNGYSYSREEGSSIWRQSLPSPGFPNTPEGIEEYTQSIREQEVIGIYINEFMASNSTTIMDKYGVFSDWIELYNANDYDVDISGFGISDKINQPLKHSLSEGTIIPARGYLLIFCSGFESQPGDDEIHVPFKLGAYKEDVVLSTPRGTIIDSFSYTNQEADVSMARIPDGIGAFEPCTRPTPGYSNDDAGYAAFAASQTNILGDVYISEMMGMNGSTLKAPDDKSYDWIELHNRGEKSVSLLGWGLSKSAKNPAKWVFPDIMIEPGEYLVIYASGLNLKETKNNLHTNFKLSADGESVFLFSESAHLVDKLQSGAFLNDISFGKDDDGRLAYFTAPTPGYANGKGYDGITASPSFVTTPGIYTGGIEIILSAPEGETIHYTLDCTTPTKTSPVYTEPISVGKNTVVRAISIRENYITGYTNTGTFLFTGDGANHTLPIVTLVTDPDNLWSNGKGIYAYGPNYNPDLTYDKILESAQYFLSKLDRRTQGSWERPAAFSIFDDNGSLEFSQNVTIRIAGSFGRGRAQKGFNIIARDTNGNNRLEYPFFETREFTEYKAIVLRAGGQDQSAGKFRDELAAGLLEGSDVNFLYQAYKPYVLYLNGEYWGVYFMKEKRNRFFVAQHEGTGDNQNLDLIRSESFAHHGSTNDWKNLMAYVRQNDLANAEAYRYVDERVDLNSFMDYMICEIYVANSDYWNIQYYKTENGKWKWIYYDFCWTFGKSENGYRHPTLTLRRESSKPCSDLFNALLKNADWKDRFVRRFAQLLNTIYSPERVIAKIDELYSSIDSEMAREREKFNQATFMGQKQPTINASTYATFTRQVEVMKEFANLRPGFLIEQLQKELNLSDAYIKEVFDNSNR